MSASTQSWSKKATDCWPLPRCLKFCSSAVPKWRVTAGHSSWWHTYAFWKIWVRQLGWWNHWKRKKEKMFQTTNQFHDLFLLKISFLPTQSGQNDAGFGGFGAPSAPFQMQLVFCHTKRSVWTNSAKKMACLKIGNPKGFPRLFMHIHGEVFHD